jgi:pimeloyl-ACP methyl ester carboxylesterase
LETGNCSARAFSNEVKKGSRSAPKSDIGDTSGNNPPARNLLPTKTPYPEEKFTAGSGGIGGLNVRRIEAVEEHWLELPDGRMRYLKVGSGPALILIHGLLGYAFSWRFTMPALAPYATVYAIDNLGAGFSAASEGMDCSVCATAERVLQFADAIGIRQFDVLGTSHGGGVAIMTAAISRQRRESRVRRLILAAPVNPWSPHGRQLAPFIGSALGSMLFRNTVARWRSFDYVWLSRMFGDSAKIPPDSLNGYRMPVLENNALLYGSRVVKSWTADIAALEKALSQIRDYPTLLMWGTKDRAVDFRSAEPLRRNFSNVRLVTFEGVGHLPYEEAPAEFNSALVSFLSGDSSFSSQFSVSGSQ